MNEQLIIKKIYDDVILPKKGTTGSSGLDLFSYLKNDLDKIIIEPGMTKMIPTGISLIIPNGFEVQIRSRSGLAAKNNVFVLNSPGTIDSDYTGEVLVLLTNLGKTDFIVNHQMRIAQMIIMRTYTDDLYIADVINKNNRDSGGCGSTGLYT